MSPKKKTMSFTGCWTCRHRKVKCDERVINGCGICEAAGIACEGYDVKLLWVTGKAWSSASPSRRTIAFNSLESSMLPASEVDRALEKLDCISPTEQTTSLGPFSVYRPQAPHQAVSIDHESLSEDTQIDVALPGPPSVADGVHSVSTGGTSELQLAREDDPADGDAEADEPEEDISASQSRSSAPTFSWALATRKLQQSPNATSPFGLDIDSLDWLMEHPSTTFPLPVPSVSLLQTPSPVRSIIPRPTDHDRGTSMLIHHYINYTANLLQPVEHRENPWKTTYIPLAFGDPSRRSATTNSSGTHMQLNVALFHGMLATAAFHLGELRGDALSMEDVAVEHRGQALKYLRGALNEPPNPHRYKDLMTVLLALVSADLMSGGDSDFAIHLEAARRLQQSRHNARFVSLATRQLNSICNFLSLIARTTAKQLPLPWNADREYPPAALYENSNVIEYIYGITSRLAQAMEKTQRLARFLAYYQAEADMPHSLLDACEQLSDELASWDITNESFEAFGSEDHDMLTIARYQAQAFHSAALFDYYRVVQGSPASDLEREQAATLESLTAAENFKDTLPAEKRRIAPISWPAFVTSIEATDRQPWRVWWTRIQAYRMGNFKRQWRLVQELWDLADAGVPASRWRDTLASRNISILPI